MTAPLDNLRAALAPAVPPPLPPVREDPAWLEAQTVADQYTHDAQAARQDHTLTDIARAQRIAVAWKTTVDRISQLRADLFTRRRARVEWIETQLPVGPGIIPGTSPADRTVLMTSFTAAYDKARQANSDQRERMLADAQRFDDDTTRRAVLTAAIDDSQWPLVDGWAAQHATATAALLTEWRELRDLLHGTGGTDGIFTSRGFQPPQRPGEWFELPRLVAAHNAAAIEHNRSPGRGNAPARPIIDLGDLLTPPTGLR